MDFRYRNGAMPKRHFETPAALPADAFFGGKFMTHVSPNENKMSDGGRARASLGVGVWKSSQKWSVQRSAVRSIAWLGVSIGVRNASIDNCIEVIPLLEVVMSE